MITDSRRALLEAYLEEAYRWNVRVNLTTVSRGSAWERHVLESRRLLDAVRTPAGAAVVDVGSGMGVPGIPLAVLRPDLGVTLLEADARKAGFLIHVSGLLGLTNVRVVPRRAELTGQSPASRESFDLAVSRGAAPMAVLCELALPLLRVGGTLAALVSEFPSECAAAARICGGGPPTRAAAGVVVITKISATPAAYPRRPGLPGRRPLSG